VGVDEKKMLACCSCSCCFVGGAVGASAFTSFRVYFDRNPGLTTGGATAGGTNPPAMSDYYYLNYNKSN
jgi:hypothetical protein